MPPFTTRRYWIPALAVAVVALAPLQWVSPRQVSDDFWRHLHVNGSEIEQYDNLESMAGSADAVVKGRITDIAAGRVFGWRDDMLPNPEWTRVQYATITVEISELLAGALRREDMERVALEVMVGSEETGSLRSSLPTEDGFFFLRSKGDEARRLGLSSERIEEERPFYRLVIADGLLRIFDGRVAPAFAADQPFLLELEGMPADDVRARIIAADAISALRQDRAG